MPNVRFDDYDVVAAILVIVILVVVVIGSTAWAIVGRIPTSLASLLNTGALVVITAFYALFTFYLVRESRKGREQRVAPTLVLDNRGKRPGVLVVKNIGNGPAIDLTIQARLKPGSRGPELRINRTHLPVGAAVSIFENDLHNLRSPGDELYDKYDEIVVDFDYTIKTGKSDSGSYTKGLSKIRPSSDLR